MLEDYFDLQLKFAASYASVADVPFHVAVGLCTNLRRRLNLMGPSGAERWEEFLRHAGDPATDHSSALSACMSLFAARPKLDQPQAFGCFSYDPPDQSGALRIHFMPTGGSDESPLALSSQSARTNELRSMFLHVRRTEHSVTSVRGVSWLYNLNAYKRLFPPPYGASVRLPWFPLHMNGSSTWGQVLNWRQEIKPSVRDAVVTKLGAIKRDAPWEVFPLRALVATSEIRPFYDWFH